MVRIQAKENSSHSSLEREDEMQKREIGLNLDSDSILSDKSTRLIDYRSSQSTALSLM